MNSEAAPRRTGARRTIKRQGCRLAEPRVRGCQARALGKCLVVRAATGMAWPAQRPQGFCQGAGSAGVGKFCSQPPPIADRVMGVSVTLCKIRRYGDGQHG